MRPAMTAILSLAALAGCTTNSGVEVGPTFAPARYVPPAPQAQATAATTRAGRRGSGGLSGVAAVAQANRSATVEPTSETMDGATWAIEDADSAAIYRLPLSFGLTTVILLPPGERFNGAVGGNAGDFLVTIYYAGPRPALSVSPRRHGAKGNMQVMTTGGLYSFVLAPSRGVAVNIVDVQRRSGRLTAPGITGMPQPEGDFTRLAILPEGRAPLPAWAPVAAWADSRKMVVEFNGPLPKLPSLLAGRRGEQTVSYTTRQDGGRVFLIATPRTTEAKLVLGGEAVGITVDPAAVEQGTAADPTQGAEGWKQAEALPSPPPGANVAVVVMPGHGAGPATAAYPSPFGFGSFGPSLPVTLPAPIAQPGSPAAAPEPPKKPRPEPTPEWL